MVFDKKFCFSFEIINHWLINLSAIDVTVTTIDAEIRLRTWRPCSKDHRVYLSSSMSVMLDICKKNTQSRLKWGKAHL